MDPWSLTTYLICFGGGIIGAGLGALYSLILCCGLIVAGCLSVVLGGSDFLLLQVGLGPIFGVHCGGFCSGVVAITYAEGVRKNAPGGPGTGKDILSPLIGTSWDVLVVGGLWAVLAHTFLGLLSKVPVINWFDCLALTVVAGNMLSRLFFQKCPPWGLSESIKKYGYFGTGDGAIQWVAWQQNPLSKAVVLGLGVGLVSAACVLWFQAQLAPLVAKSTVSPVAAFVAPLIFTFALACISLMGLNWGTGKIQQYPVWHHIALLSSLAMLLFGSVIVAGIVGMLAALLGELMARLFWNHGTNHIDPPACSIAFGTFLLNIVNKIVT